MRPPALIRLYAVAANLIAPLAYRRIATKLKAQGTNPARLPERMGRARLPRPKGPLIWFHAASIGESLSILRLITHMGAANPTWWFLLTTGTATSAEVLAKRLPPRCVHQFAPLDARAALRRFLDHWQPTAAIFVESELWPQMLSQTHARGIPLALINARLSDRSARRWKRFPKTARYLLGQFSLIQTQDSRTTAHLHDLGLSHAQTGQNLKSISGPLPYDAAELTHLRTTLSDRPLWLALSTHPDEDEIMLKAHKTLLKAHPDLLLILVPRHPARADRIETLITDHGFQYEKRSTGGQITCHTQVYLADTIGETGLWLALSPITCICGSFTPMGGHNPYEPAHAGSAILHGGHITNFAQAYADLNANGGAVQMKNADELEKTLNKLLSTPAQLDQMRQNARVFASQQDDTLE
ncbi:3-deoxy-D-manno-octulosonic acid transferase, partial [hydrothermal vent metagenome]